MDTPAADTRLAANLLLAGGVLAVIGNLLHPFLSAEINTPEFLSEIRASSIWVPVHLLIGVSIAVLVVALVLTGQLLTGARAERLADIAAVVAVVSGTIWVVQIAALDGIALPAIAETTAGGEAAALAAAEAVVAVDQALLTLSILAFLGVTFTLYGAAFLAGSRFPAWLAWVAIITGIGGIVTGVIQAVDGISDLTINWLFRPLAGVGTLVALAAGGILRRQAAGVRGRGRTVAAAR